MAKETKEELHNRFDEEVNMVVIMPDEVVKKDLKKALTDWDRLVSESFNKLGE